MSKVELPQGEEKYKHVQAMFDDIAPTYEKTNTFITFGLDKYARNLALKELRITPGSVVIDMAAGTGDFSRMLVDEGAIPIACDFSYGMLSHARSVKKRVQCDGTRMPFANNTCDAIVCGYGLRNFVELEKLFFDSMRVLKPGGRFVAVDVSVPTNPVLKAGNKLWLGSVAPKIGWLISKNKNAYEYLPKSVNYLPPKEKMVEIFESLNAENIQIRPLIGGSLVLISATKPIQGGNE